MTPLPTRPIISIIMPAWQASQTLAEAIDSIQQQTCLQWELLIWNDGSTDTTQAVAEHYAAQDSRIRLLGGSSPAHHTGRPGQIRNMAAQYAQGQYLVFWDADDVFPSEALQRYLKGFKTTAHTTPVVLVYGFLKNMAADGTRLECSAFPLVKHKTSRPEALLYSLPSGYTHSLRQIALGYFPATAAFCVDKHFFEQMGGFDTSLTAAEDMAFYLRAFRLHWQGQIQICAIPHYQVYYRQQVSSLSTPQTQDHYQRLLSAHLQALQGLFLPLPQETTTAAQALNFQLEPLRSAAMARRYAYVIGRTLIQQQNTPGKVLLHQLLEDACICWWDKCGTALPLWIRLVCLPHTLERFLHQQVVSWRALNHSRRVSEGHSL